jgi:hypothetical protein
LFKEAGADKDTATTMALDMLFAGWVWSAGVTAENMD